MLNGGLYIKEAFATIMASEIKDGVAYIGWKETSTLLHLYKWKDDAAIENFNRLLREKLIQPKSSSHDADRIKKTMSREYLKSKVPPIVELLNLKLVTDFDEDHLLRVKRKNAHFVYFGAMTKEYIHVACWLRIPLNNKTIDYVSEPKLFFWVLHTSYAQELEALGDLAGEGNIDVNALRDLLDLTDGIDYDLPE